MYYDVQNTTLSLSLLKWPYFPVAHRRLTAILTATGTRLGGRWRTLKGSLRVDPSSNGPQRTRVNVLWVASALARREARGSYLGRLANQDRAWCCQGGLVHGACVGTVPATRSNSGRCGAEQFRVEVA
jgi:hypothetical protein